MADRFIKLYDKILSWEWYKNTNVKVLFIHLLLKANYKDASFEGHKILRGQLVTSLVSLSSELGMTVKQIRGSLDHLIATGEVASRSYPRYRVITIVHYDDYQAVGSQTGSQTAGERAGKGQAEGKQRAGLGQAEGKQRATSIEYIDNKEQIEKIEQIEHSPGESDLFEDFWSAYPRKQGKENARKAFAKLKPDGDMVWNMLAAIEKQKNSAQWQEGGGRYIPLPASWLNGKRWEDETITSAPEQKPAMKPTKTVTAQQYSQRDYSEYTLDSQIAAMLALEGT